MEAATTAVVQDKSKQSAKECRKRKKLRYLTLEATAQREEQAIEMLYAELEQLRSLYERLDNGRLSLDQARQEVAKLRHRQQTLPPPPPPQSSKPSTSRRPADSGRAISRRRVADGTGGGQQTTGRASLPSRDHQTAVAQAAAAPDAPDAFPIANPCQSVSAAAPALEMCTDSHDHLQQLQQQQQQLQQQYIHHSQHNHLLAVTDCKQYYGQSVQPHPYSMSPYHEQYQLQLQDHQQHHQPDYQHQHHGFYSGPLWFEEPQLSPQPLLPPPAPLPPLQMPFEAAATTWCVLRPEHDSVADTLGYINNQASIA